MLDLLNCRMASEFRWKRQEGKRWFSTFGKGFTGFSNDIYLSVISTKTRR
jgi:hypothetical protein